MTAEELTEILEEATCDAAKLLAERIKEGRATAADINCMRAMAKELGVSLSLNAHRTPAGDSVLESLADIDPELLN